MLHALKSAFRQFLTGFGRMLIVVLFRVTIVGAENVPPRGTPLIVISNHFSWFDAPILTLLLPVQPAYLVATESMRHWWVRFFINTFDGIPIWRGQVDRTALGRSLRVLKNGRAIGIFPEGGMNPLIAERIARGERINQLRGHTSRRSGKLVKPRPGSALLAVQSQAKVLPVGIIGSENILTNFRRLRRTPITIIVGPAFGPLALDPALRGPMKRQGLDTLSDLMMRHIARLFPVGRRGPYEEADLSSAALEAGQGPAITR